MKLFRLITLFLFCSVISIAQESAVTHLQKWQENYLSASKTYSELIKTPEKFENDSVLQYNLNFALDKIVLSLSNAKDAILLDTYYAYDARYMMVESSLLGLWFCQNENAQEVFTDTLALAFMDVCEKFRTTYDAIPFYELHFYEIEIDAFYQSYYDQMFLKFIMAVKEGDAETVYKVGDEYLSFLLLSFDRDFPAIIFYDSKYVYEQPRVYKILEEITPSATTKRKMLELKLLKLEYLANFYYYEKQVDSTFALNQYEENEITACEKFIKDNPDEFQKIEEANLRLADAYLLLEDFDSGLRYYSREILKESTSISDIKSFATFTMTIGDTTNNFDVKTNSMLYVDNAANLIVKKESPIEDTADLRFLLKCYEFSGNEKKKASVRGKLTELERQVLEREAKEKRRELYGFRMGIAPARFVYGSQHNHFAVTGDLKINGFEQGFRYCRYNNFQDHYRFGAWIYTGDTETAYNTYNADEISYWVTVANFVFEDMEQKVCVEARYGQYRFNTVYADIINRETDLIQFYDFDTHPVGHRYDISAVYRVSIFASNIFYVEGNFALGVGFRYLTSEFNNNKFKIDDDRYSDSRWPMITAPVRFGLRCGIRFF